MPKTVVMLPPVECAERTHPGRDPDKQTNEDACAYRQTRLGHLFVLCDGMGGHAAGQEASRMAVDTIVAELERAEPGVSPQPILRSAIEEANRRVRSLGSDRERPGSTVVVLLVHAMGAEVAHVGDSRCYHMHDARIEQVTQDHSLVQEMVNAGVLTFEQAKKHPDANKITRALGMKVDVEVDVRPQPIPYVAGDAFLLCSDGLCDLVEPEEMLRAVSSGSAAQAAGQLVDLANARGGHDNITVQIVRTRQTAQPSRDAPTIVQGADTSPMTIIGPPPLAGPMSRPAGPAHGTVPPLGARPKTPWLLIIVTLVFAAMALLAVLLARQSRPRPAVVPSATVVAPPPTPVAPPEPLPIPAATPESAPLPPLDPPPDAKPHKRFRHE